DHALHGSNPVLCPSADVRWGYLPLRMLRRSFSGNAVFLTWSRCRMCKAVSILALRAAIFVLRRSASMPKSIWRFPSNPRMLPPITQLQTLVDKALHVWTVKHASMVLIEGEISEDGSDVRTRVPRLLKPYDSAGVFDLSATDEKVKLRISQEGC